MMMFWGRLTRNGFPAIQDIDLDALLFQAWANRQAAADTKDEGH